MNEEQIKCLLDKLTEMESLYMYKSRKLTKASASTYYQGKYSGVHKAIELIKKAQAGHRLV